MGSPIGKLGGWFQTLWFYKSLLILDGNINKNYFSICDFVLLITTSNVVWWDKNVKTILQEEVNIRLDTSL
jgi:hypothetical protein